MIKTFNLIILLVLFMTISPVFAEDENLLTLDKSIEIALKKNLAIRSAREAVKGAEYNKKSAFSDFLPKLSSTYSYTRLDEEPSFSMGGTSYTTGAEDNYDFSLTLEQPVYTGRSLINIYERAKLGIDISKIREDQARQDVILEVKEAYFSILKAEKIREVAEQSVRQIESHVRRAKEFYDAEMIPKNDLLQAEVQLAQAKQDMIKSDNGVNIAKSLFNTLLRRGINKEVTVEDILKYKPVNRDLNEFIAIAYRERPELKELILSIEDAKKGIELSKSKYYPTVSLRGSYLKEGEEATVDEEESWNVMAIAQWTFWEWGKTGYQVSESRTGMARAEYAREQMKDWITLEVKESYLNIKEAEKNIFVAKKAIEQAEENFRMNEERYKEQIATSTEVLDAQTLLTQTRTNYYNALNDYNIAKARLERAIGVK